MSKTNARCTPWAGYTPTPLKPASCHLLMSTRSVATRWVPYDVGRPVWLRTLLHTAHAARKPVSGAAWGTLLQCLCSALHIRQYVPALGTCESRPLIHCVTSMEQRCKVYVPTLRHTYICKRALTAFRVCRPCLMKL